MTDKLLELTVVAVTSSLLDIRVKNSSGAALTKGLLIEINIPLELVTDDIKKAAEEALNVGLVRLDKYVTAAKDWSVWAFNEASGTLATIQVLNDTDQQTGAPITPVKFEAGATFNLRIPVNDQAKSAQVGLPYGYEYEKKRIDDTLVLIPSDGPNWEPGVMFTTNEESPTAIPAKREVTINWKIKDGVSATLRGPLTGGNSKLTLSSDPADRNTGYWMEEGSMQFVAVGPAIYTLDAEVRDQNNKNVRVIKTLQFDILRGGKYGYLSVRPKPSLPYALVDIDWAVWGVKSITLKIGAGQEYDPPLTKQNLSRDYQGSGTWAIHAPEPKLDTEGVKQIYMKIKQGTKPVDFVETTLQVTNWETRVKPKFTGTPLGLAVAAPKIALLTTDGLWIGRVGNNDQDLVKHPVLKKVEAGTAKAWIALTTLNKDFVVLRQTAEGGLQVARFKNSDERIGTPIDLPYEVQWFVKRSGTVYDLAALGNRVYVVIESGRYGRAARRAYSVSFDPDDWRSEPLLRSLYHYSLVNFNDALYVVNRDSGQMFRFELNEDGELDKPRKAATAISDGKSMIQNGLLAPVGSVLAVLSPNAVPSFDAMATLFLGKIVSPEVDPNEIPQDVVYNPQKDIWERCGHGLDNKKGAVIAFRGGASKRLWLMQPEGELYSLAGGREELFVYDYVDNYPSADLPVYLDKSLKIDIKNDTKASLFEMTDDYVALGLDTLSSTGPVEAEPMPSVFLSDKTYPFEFRYNEADPTPITVRYLIEAKPAKSPDHIIEFTFSGPGLSSITSVFKRIAIDKQDRLSIGEVAGSLVTYPANRPFDEAFLKRWRRQNPNQPDPQRPIEVKYPEQFKKTFKFMVFNATPYTLHQVGMTTPMPDIGRYREVKVGYNTPDFSIFSREMGDLHFTIDFTKQHGIEMSSRSKIQESMIRIDPDESKGLVVEIAKMLNPGDPPLTVEHQGGKEEVSATDGPVYVCQIVYKFKQELNAVCIGDGAVNPRGDWLYLPVADPTNVPAKTIMKVRADNLSITPGYKHSGGGEIFSLPNSMMIYEKKALVMLGDTNLLELNDSMEQVMKTRSYGDYTAIAGMANDSEYIHLLAIKKEGTNDQNAKYHYMLVSHHYQSPTVRDAIPLDPLGGTRGGGGFTNQPAWVSSSTNFPMAALRVPRKVAICIDGGLMLIDVRSDAVKVVALESTGREEAIAFNETGEFIYCLHSQPNNQGLKLSRVHTDNPQAKPVTLSLPSSEAVSDLITNTRGEGTPRERRKHMRAASLAITPYPNTMFVSQGKSILQINTESLTVVRSATVELPCRLIHVTQKDSSWMIYAIGATGTSDGGSVKEYKTHLYKLAVLTGF